MKHIQIELSKKFILAVILILTGIVIFGVGIKNMIEISRCRDLKDITMTGLKEGDYVSGNISKVAGYYTITAKGRLKYIANQSTFFSSEGWEEYYIIPIGQTNSQYMTVLVTKKYTDIFETFHDKENSENTYRITGKIIKRDDLLNYTFLKKAFEVSSEEAVNQLIPNNYAIKLVDFKVKKSAILKGTCLIAAGLYLLLSEMKKTLRYLTGEVSIWKQ